jgi:putative transposase
MTRIEPDPETLWNEAEPLVETARGVLVVDDSTLDTPDATHIELVTRPWSGTPQKRVRGINLITWLWTVGDRKIPVDDRLYSTADGKIKHDHFWELLLLARGRGFAPKYVLCGSWCARLENLKQVRDQGWLWLTRLRGDRVVSPADRRARPLDEVAGESGAGTVLHLRGSGMVWGFRIDAPDGATAWGVTNDLTMDAGMRRHDATVRFGIENFHRVLKQNCGLERCQARSERAQIPESAGSRSN